MVGSSATMRSGSRAPTHRDEDALEHAAAELMRIGGEDLVGRPDADLRQPTGGGVGPPVPTSAQDSPHVPADALGRVEGTDRILDDHPEAPPAKRRQHRLAAQQVVAVEGEPSGRGARPGWQEPQEGKAREGLARARFADQAEGLAAREREVDPRDRRPGPGGTRDAHREVGDGQERGWHDHERPRSLGSASSRRPSPEQVQSEERERDEQAGEREHPRGLAEHLAAFRHDGAERGLGRLDAEPDEAQARLDHDAEGEPEGRLHQERARDVRQDLAKEDACARLADHPCGSDVGLAAGARRKVAAEAHEDRCVDESDGEDQGSGAESEHDDEEQREDEAREREQEVGEAKQHGGGEPATLGCDQTREGPGKCRESNARSTDGQRQPGPREHAGEHVAPKGVGAERVLPVRGHEKGEDVHVRGIVGRQGGPEADEQRDEAGDEGAEWREAVGEEGAHARV